MVEEVAAGLDFNKLLDQNLGGNIRQHHILRVLVENSEAVWNARAILLFFSFDGLPDFIHVGAFYKLRVLNDLSQSSVAGVDVAFYDFLEVFICLFAYLQLRADIRTNSLILLFNINMNNICLKKLPSQREVIVAFRGGAEIELTIILLLQESQGLNRADVLEALVLDFSLVNLGFFLVLLLVLLLFEVDVYEVFFGVLDSIDLINILFVASEVALLAFQNYRKVVV